MHRKRCTLPQCFTTPRLVSCGEDFAGILDSATLLYIDFVVHDCETLVDEEPQVLPCIFNVSLCLIALHRALHVFYRMCVCFILFAMHFIVCQRMFMYMKICSTYVIVFRLILSCSKHYEHFLRAGI